MYRNAAINIVLRGLTLGARLLLIIVLARFLSPEEVGVYGLLVSVVGIATFVLGFEFFRFNMRVLVPETPVERLAHVRDQGVFHTLLALVVLPLLLTVFALDILPAAYAAWFYVLLVLDVVSREGSNLLVTLSQSATANLVLFLRGGGWVFALVAYWLVARGAADLGGVCLAWSLGSAASVAVAGVATARLLPRSSPLPAIDWRWIWAGARVSLRFLVLVLAMQGFLHAPRLFLQHFRSEAEVGIYTFYSGLSGPIQAFIEAGVIAILSPRAIQAYHRQIDETYRAVLGKMILQTTALLAVLVGLSAAGIFVVLDLVGTPAYGEDLRGYWLLLAVSALMALSWPPQLDLYVRGLDRAIVLCSLASLAVAIGLYVLLIPGRGVVGAALATLIAAATLLLSQSAVCVTSRRKRLANVLAEDGASGSE